MNDDRKELIKHIKEEIKKFERRGIKHSKLYKEELFELTNIKSNFALEDLKNNKYNLISSSRIYSKQLEELYLLLYNKLKKSTDFEKIYRGKNNIFDTILSNIDLIYNLYGYEYVRDIVYLYYSISDENKLDVIGKYFAKSYKLKKTNEDFLNVLLTKIKETDNLEKLNNLSLLLEDEFYFMDTWLYDNKENILKIICNSKSEYNSKMIGKLINILIGRTSIQIIRNLENNSGNFIKLFELFAYSNNELLINTLYTLITTMHNFNYVKDFSLQDKCIDLLENLSQNKDNDLNLYLNIILNVIVKSNNQYIQDYLIEKLKHINNKKTLELIHKISPLLLELTNEDEYIRIIDNMEDKNSITTKKLVINLNKEE